MAGSASVSSSIGSYDIRINCAAYIPELKTLLLGGSITSSLEAGYNHTPILYGGGFDIESQDITQAWKNFSKDMQGNGLCFGDGFSTNDPVELDQLAPARVCGIYSANGILYVGIADGYSMFFYWNLLKNLTAPGKIFGGISSWVLLSSSYVDGTVNRTADETLPLLPARPMGQTSFIVLHGAVVDDAVQENLNTIILYARAQDARPYVYCFVANTENGRFTPTDKTYRRFTKTYSYFLDDISAAREEICAFITYQGFFVLLDNKFSDFLSDLLVCSTDTISFYSDTVARSNTQVIANGNNNHDLEYHVKAFFYNENKVILWVLHQGIHPVSMEPISFRVTAININAASFTPILTIELPTPSKDFIPSSLGVITSNFYYFTHIIINGHLSGPSNFSIILSRTDTKINYGRIDLLDQTGILTTPYDHTKPTSFTNPFIATGLTKESPTDIYRLFSFLPIRLENKNPKYIYFGYRNLYPIGTGEGPDIGSLTMYKRLRPIAGVIDNNNNNAGIVITHPIQQSIFCTDSTNSGLIDIIDEYEIKNPGLSSEALIQRVMNTSDTRLTNIHLANTVQSFQNGEIVLTNELNNEMSR